MRDFLYFFYFVQDSGAFATSHITWLLSCNIPERTS